MGCRNLSLSGGSMLVQILLVCCLAGVVRTQRQPSRQPPALAAPSESGTGAGGYLDIRRDNSYRYAYATGDVGRHYHTAAGSPDNTVTGRYGQRDPKTGANQETTYSAGRNGFRARGPHIARKQSLTQNKIPYNPPVNPNSPNYKPSFSGYNDPNNDAAYEFGFRSPTHSRQEVSNAKGTVEGTYTYVDDVGVRHNVAYEAGAKTGFHVKTPYPDTDNIGGALFYRKPNKNGKGFRGHSAIQRNLDGSFRFTATGPDLKHTETSDKHGNRRGTYTYLDPKGVQRTTEYIAGPNIGYKVINTKLSGQFAAAYPFLPNSFLIPPTDGLGGVRDPENLNLAATGRPTQQLSSETPGEFEEKPEQPEDETNDSAGSESAPDDFNPEDSGSPGRPRPTRPRPGGGDFQPGGRPQAGDGSGESFDGGPGEDQRPGVGDGGDGDGDDSPGSTPGGGSDGYDNDFFGSTRPTGGFGATRPSGSGFGSGGFGSTRPTGSRPPPGDGFGFGGDNTYGQNENKPTNSFPNTDPFAPSSTRPGDNFGQNSNERPVGGSGDSTGFGTSENSFSRPTTRPPPYRPPVTTRPTPSRPTPSRPTPSRPPPYRPPSRPQTTRPPYRPPSFPPAEIRPTYGYGPSAGEPDDDAIFGPSASGNNYGTTPRPLVSNDVGDISDDDIFGPKGSASPIDFSKPINNEDLNFNRPPKRPPPARPSPGRPPSRPPFNRPQSGRPGGFGPDNQDGIGNCCRNRGNVKFNDRAPYSDGHTQTREYSSSFDQQSAQNVVRERFFSFPPGVAVRAHVQSLDIVPYGSRVSRSEDQQARRQREANASQLSEKDKSEE